jgi:HD-GYP domain-containing protein (c-di-GMP phosphodiesterase class II)
MKLKINQLKEGFVIAENVIGKTGRPIVSKNTTLTSEHLEVLKAFLIESVQIKKVQGQIEPNIPTKDQDKGSFNQLYSTAVKEYKKLFMNWQAGANVNLFQVRNIMLPLFENSLEDSKDILTIYKLNSVSDYIFHHSVSVAVLSAYLGKKLKLQKGDCFQLGIGGLLSDCGMAKVPPYLFGKKDKLNKVEFGEVKKHTILGYQMLKKVTGIKEGVLLCALQHHERENGSGYPLSTKSKQLHLFSQIVAIVDVFHAMTSERIHSKIISPFIVLEEMLNHFDQFNPKILKVLVDEWINISVGLKVRLNNGQVGEIVFVENSSPTKPLVKLEQQGGEILSLKNQQDIFIEEVLS